MFKKNIYSRFSGRESGKGTTNFEKSSNNEEKLTGGSF
jgi:hypothetical protein